MVTKVFMGYLKLLSNKVADELDAIAKEVKNYMFEICFET